MVDQTDLLPRKEPYVGDGQFGSALEGAPVWLIAYRGELWKNEVWLGEGEKAETGFSMSLKVLKGGLERASDGAGH